MTPELRALLERIAEAGGPVLQLVERPEMLRALLPLEPHGHSVTLAALGDWGHYDDAILIAALKLDARARGARVMVTEHLPLPVKHPCPRFEVTFLNTGRAIKPGVNDDEAAAHCEAWLAAFSPEAGQ